MPGIFARVFHRIGRVMEPLLDPDAADRRKREAALIKRLETSGAAVSRLAEQVAKVTERVDKIDRRQIDHLGTAVSALQWNTRRQATLAERLARASSHGQEHEFARDRVLRRLLQLARRDAPVLIGPWTGEVGFELLYWAPFVRWAVRKFNIDPSRITIVSRGGTASWYAIEGARYLDVFELSSPSEFRTETAQARKQRTLRLFDRTLIRRVVAANGGPMALLHPAMMYRLFMPYWKHQVPRGWVEQYSEFTRVTPPAIAGLQLPREYVAVRFYFSECFPDTPDNREVVASLVQSLASETDVVVLGGVRVDDHEDVQLARSERVHTVDHAITPENSLAVQTAVIGRARAFIGTYGGFSYLAPLCGVNTVALYSRRTFFVYHMDFAQQLFDDIEGGTLTVMDAATRPLTRHLAPATADVIPPARR
jgi:hypothetical protein